MMVNVTREQQSTIRGNTQIIQRRETENIPKSKRDPLN